MMMMIMKIRMMMMMIKIMMMITFMMIIRGGFKLLFNFFRVWEK